MTTALLTGVLCAYVVTMLAAGAGEILRKALLRRAGFWLLALAFALNAWLLGWLWMDSGRPPFKTLYETLLLAPFCIALVGLVMVRLERLYLLTAFAAGGALLCLWYAVSHPDWEMVLMPPALQSAWFVPHVITYFISYAALFIAFVLAALALLNKPAAMLGAMLEKIMINRLVKLFFLPARLINLFLHAICDAEVSFEEAANKAAVFGFVALTLGLAMGAAWGKSAWGSYWQWDPKENWAFITWLAYLGYLHLRLLPGWRGKRALWVNLVCFGIVLFTYLCVNMLPTAGSSLHVYQ